MVDRRNTPDILASMGALPKERILSSRDRHPDAIIHQSFDQSSHVSTEGVEETLTRATQALTALGGVLGRKKLIRWLDEIRDTILTQKDQGFSSQLSIPDITIWLTKHLKAANTAPYYLITGRIVEHPYKVDIWARFIRRQTQTEMWIECWDKNSLVKPKDILSLVRKAVDVFYAAHADKRVFSFDRLMLISSSPFDPIAIAAANRYGVSCVLYDNLKYTFQACEDWQQKPKWLAKAEETLEELQG